MANRFNPLWDSKLFLPLDEKRSLEKPIAFTLSSPNVFCQPGLPSRFVFTDASNEALGVVIFANGRAEVHSRGWSSLEEPLPTNAKEPVAACQGGETVFLGVDNTTAFFDIISGKSPNPVANECAGTIRRITALALNWIPARLMPVDGPSRNIVDPKPKWKAITVLHHTTRHVFLPAPLGGGRAALGSWITLGVSVAPCPILSPQPAFSSFGHALRGSVLCVASQSTITLLAENIRQTNEPENGERTAGLRKAFHATQSDRSSGFRASDGSSECSQLCSAVTCYWIQVIGIV